MNFKPGDKVQFSGSPFVVRGISEQGVLIESMSGHTQTVAAEALRPAGQAEAKATQGKEPQKKGAK